MQAELASARERQGAIDARLEATDRRLGAAARRFETADARLAKLELLTEHPDIDASTNTIGVFPSPAVTVVMPTWNREAVIGAAIRSVQAQTIADWELIVVDDGSTDRTEHVVKTFADSRICYVAQDHSGQCAARNRALGLARGSLVAYLDSDNLWYPEFLSAAVSALSAHADLDCVYGAMIRDVGSDMPRLLFEPFDRDNLMLGNYIGISTFVHRRSLVERFGGFDEGLDSLEDWDLILRYTAHAPARRLPVRAVRYREIDPGRVSLMRAHEQARAAIQAKWNAR